MAGGMGGLATPFNVIADAMSGKRAATSQSGAQPAACPNCGHGGDTGKMTISDDAFNAQLKNTADQWRARGVKQADIDSYVATAKAGRGQK